MKTIQSVLFATTMLAASAAAQDSTRLKPVPVPGCHAQGVTVQTLYGKASQVLSEMKKMPNAFPSNRFRLMVIESRDSAEIYIYERGRETSQYTLSRWSGKGIGDLRQDLDKMNLATRGSSCAGEETLRMLNRRGMRLDVKNVNDPAGLYEAFAPFISDNAGVLRVTFEELCLPAGNAVMSQSAD